MKVRLEPKNSITLKVQCCEKVFAPSMIFLYIFFSH